MLRLIQLVGKHISGFWIHKQDGTIKIYIPKRFVGGRGFDDFLKILGQLRIRINLAKQGDNGRSHGDRHKEKCLHDVLFTKDAWSW